METSFDLTYPDAARVTEVATCELFVGSGAWAYAVENAAAIEVHWQKAKIENPAYFNGRIFLVDALRIERGALHARLLATEFKNYLHWRANGFPQSGVRDGFGSALIETRDGCYLLGRQRKGNVNAGLAYLPSGFIDPTDASPGGAVAIAASILREAGEETGLGSERFRPDAGFIVTEHGPQLSIAQRLSIDADAVDVKAEVDRFIAADTNSELEEIIMVKDAVDIASLAMPAYARVLITKMLTNRSARR